MTNVETISYYEKLHDLFEQIHPQDIPAKLEKMIKYLEDGAEHHLINTGHEADVNLIIEVLIQMRNAFAASLSRTNRSCLITNEERKYEVNILPIMAFLKENTSLEGDIEELKTLMVEVANVTNIGMMKQNYLFADSLSMVL
jgi:hypothetical protein